MKPITFLILLGLAPKVGMAQIVYFEDFGTGCTTGTLATAIGWTVTNTGANQATANIWYVSADEQGVGAGNCGVGCGGTQSRTLHLGAAAAAGGDLGAAYFESSAFVCSFLGLCSITNKRVESPTINCTGISSIPLRFDYIENGEGTADDCTVFYSPNNGATWTLLDNPPKTTLCGIQGLWATRNLVLPASADNNPTVKIGFRWVNNGNGVGTDPSFAVDNIQVGTPIILDVELVDMNVECGQGIRSISWITQNEHNADYFNVYQSSDALSWERLATIEAMNQSGTHQYTVSDRSGRNSSPTYYYLEEVDLDGHATSFEILSSERCAEVGEISIYPNPSEDRFFIEYDQSTALHEIHLLDITGKRITTFDKERAATGCDISTLPNGVYIVECVFEQGTIRSTLVKS
jgi:hypothetical protein